MIRSLTGTITAILDGYITVEVHGVGYLVGTTTTTTKFVIDGTVRLHTHLAVRETALDLYGFVTIQELELFEYLLQVPKIGPKSALQVLNQASPQLLVEAIERKDGVYLHKMSGIGKKTSENIVQFLHDKLTGLAIDQTFQTESTNPNHTDAIDALVSLGYDLATARETIKQVDAPEATTNELVRLALKQIS